MSEIGGPARRFAALAASVLVALLFTFQLARSLLRRPAGQKALWAAAQEKIVKAVCGVPFTEQLVMWAWRDSLDFGARMEGSLNLVPHITEKTRFIR